MNRIGSGIFEVDLKQGKVGFKFGMYASSVTQKVTGKKISEVFRMMFDYAKDEKGEISGGATTAYTESGLIHYFYGGAVAYAERNSLRIPTVDEVADWLEELGFEKAIEIYSKSLAGPNVKAPEVTNPGKATE